MRTDGKGKKCMKYGKRRCSRIGGKKTKRKRKQLFYVNLVEQFNYYIIGH